MEPTDESERICEHYGQILVARFRYAIIIVSYFDGFTNIPPPWSGCLTNGHTEEPNGSSTSPRRPATRSQTTTTGTATRGDGQDSHSDEDQGEPSSSKHTLDEDADEMEMNTRHAFCRIQSCNFFPTCT